jgi:TRAP-type C4-dicarboxylate transport system permease small subunit
MRGAFETIYRLYGKLLTLFAIAAGAIFFAMMLLIDANAFMRKLFNQPVTGTLEITEALMPIAILLPMAYTQLVGGHIRVTLLTKSLSPQVQRALLTAALLLGVGFAVWATWAAYGFALRSWQVDEHAWGTVRFPLYPSKAAIAVGTALLGIQFLLDAIRIGVFNMSGPHQDMPEAM